jgi:hypothetical protein
MAGWGVNGHFYKSPSADGAPRTLCGATHSECRRCGCCEKGRVIEPLRGNASVAGGARIDVDPAGCLKHDPMRNRAGECYACRCRYDTFTFFSDCSHEISTWCAFRKRLVNSLQRMVREKK